MPLPVISVAQMRDWEAATWAAGRAESEVIELVGQAVAEAAIALTDPGELVLVLAGIGHNGEDARRAAPHLTGRRVEILHVSDPAQASASLEELLELSPALIIDGLFGVGLNRTLAPDWVKLIGRVNSAHVPVLAIDLPSGIDGNTGEPLGAAIRADVTITVGAPKAGLLTPVSWDHAGRVRVAHPVGLVPYELPSEMLWTTPGDFAGMPPQRLATSHKGTYGHLAIMAGSLGYHGAAVLAARAAQRARPGLITLHTSEHVYGPTASQIQAVMVSPFRTGFKMPNGYSAHLIGPGLAAPEMRDIAAPVLRQLWRDSELPLIVDASGLDLLPADPPARAGLRVLTPHPGEAARLLRCPVEQIQANRLAAVRNLSKRQGNAWIVLKGHQTLIGRSTGEVYVNGSGNPYLAQGGSGDVLAGFLAGLLAQPAMAKDPLRTIRYAVWMHGNAADTLQRRRKTWLVEDLFAVLGD